MPSEQADASHLQADGGLARAPPPEYHWEQEEHTLSAANAPGCNPSGTWFEWDLQLLTIGIGGRGESLQVAVDIQRCGIQACLLSCPIGERIPTEAKLLQKVGARHLVSYNENKMYVPIVVIFALGI